MSIDSRTHGRASPVAIVICVIVAVACLGLGVLLGRLSVSHDHGAPASTSDETVLYWTCSMHPQVKLPKQGQCPICFMDLIPVRAGGEEGDSEVPRLSLSARARELARVETAPAELREVSVDVRMVGKIMTDETRITYISSYIPGRLDRLFVDYTGILVRKGDHLAEIYSPDLLVAQREYLLGLEAVERARQTPGSENEKAATALFEAARRKLELWGIPKDELDNLTRERRPSDHMRIDAPLEGWVIERNGYEGMYVETGTRIFTLADLRTVWVMLDAYELDIGYVRLGQEVEFETEAYPGQVFEGRVAYVDPVLDQTTRTVKVRLNVDNPDLKLRPGMFVRARLKARLGEGGMVSEESLAGKWLCPMHPEVVKDGEEQCDKCGMDLVPAETLGYVTKAAPAAKLLAVPQTAVLLTGKRAVVYVEQTKDDGTPVYEGRVVELGPRAGAHYVVKSGLEEGERVVTRGALMIDSAMQIQAKPSMMQPPAHATSPPEAERSHAVAGAMYHDHFKPVLQAYFDLAAALVADDVGKSAVSTAALRKALTGAVPHGLPADDEPTFKKHVAAIGDALPASDKATVEQRRQRLPSLTAALRTYLHLFGHNLEAPVYRVHCPMAFDDKGADWLSPEDKVLNPYFGDKMLRCGEVVGRIAPDGRESR